MTKAELEKEAEEYRLNLTAKLRLKLQEGCNCKELVDIEKAYLAGAEPREKRIADLEKENAELKTVKIPQLERKIASIRGCHSVDAKKLNARTEQVERLKKENAELKELVEKYRQAVDKCLHITFMGGGREVNTIGQYATLVDGYLTDVEGLAKLKG